jgi:hypothetical protein
MSNRSNDICIDGYQLAYLGSVVLSLAEYRPNELGDTHLEPQIIKVLDRSSTARDLLVMIGRLAVSDALDGTKRVAEFAEDLKRRSEIRREVWGRFREIPSHRRNALPRPKAPTKAA